MGYKFPERSQIIMKNSWLTEGAFELIKTALRERDCEPGELIGEGRCSAVFSQKNNSTLCVKIRPYSKDSVRKIYYARAAYQFNRKLFPYLPIPDPNRKIEFIDNTDEIREECRDNEVEPVITKGGAYLATIHERLSPIRSTNERELLKLTADIAEALDKMYDPLRYAVHGFNVGTDIRNGSDIMFSHLCDRYVLSDFSKVTRFVDNQAHLCRFTDPLTTAPELTDGIYTKTSAVYSLGCVLRMIVTRGTAPEKKLSDAIEKINSAVSPAAILFGKKNLEPLDDKNHPKYTGPFIRLINKMTMFHPDDRPTSIEAAETALRLRGIPSHLREEADI